MRKRDPAQVNKYFYATFGLYALYWLLDVAAGLDEVGVEDAPPVMQRRMWTMIFFFFIYPYLIFLYVLIGLLGETISSSIQLGLDSYILAPFLVLSPSLVIVVYPFYRTRKTIYEFWEEEPPSFEKEIMMGIKHGSIIAYWQARINERLGV